jgi:hypothetical protein
MFVTAELDVLSWELETGAWKFFVEGQVEIYYAVAR